MLIKYEVNVITGGGNCAIYKGFQVHGAIPLVSTSVNGG